MSTNPPWYAETAQWHRRLCPLTDQIVISGDLHEDPRQAVEQLHGWRRAGISHVLDTRIEWSDAELVADNVPEMVYGSIGADDVGLRQSDEWFDAGVAFAMDALGDPGAVVLIHCHMGINRGPSMAYRVLLELGWDAIDALDAIQEARPIADIAYASDALGHYHRSHGTLSDRRTDDRDRFEAWQRGYSPTGLRRKRSDSGEGPLDGEPPNPDIG